MKHFTPILILVVAVANAQNMSTQAAKTYGGVKMKVLASKPAKFPITKSESEWKKQLTPAQYHILRESGTDRPFKSKFHDNHKEGTYYSVATGKPLFSSTNKFDSGTGWPSFYKPISDAAVLYIRDKSDGMNRIEIIDAASGSHLGHAFMDGPKPTGLRFCINGEALIFKPKG